MFPFKKGFKKGPKIIVDNSYPGFLSDSTLSAEQDHDEIHYNTSLKRDGVTFSCAICHTRLQTDSSSSFTVSDYFQSFAIIVKFTVSVMGCHVRS